MAGETYIQELCCSLKAECQRKMRRMAFQFLYCFSNNSPVVLNAKPSKQKCKYKPLFSDSINSMYNKNKRGPKMDPCGTPEVRGAVVQERSQVKVINEDYHNNYKEIENVSWLSLEISVCKAEPGFVRKWSFQSYLSFAE